MGHQKHPRYEKPLFAERAWPKNRRNLRDPVPEPANPPSWRAQVPQVPPPPVPPPPQAAMPPQPMQPPPGPPPGPAPQQQQVPHLPAVQHPAPLQQPTPFQQPGDLAQGSTSKAVPACFPGPIKSWQSRLNEMSAEELNSHIIWHLEQHRRAQPSSKAETAPKPSSKCSVMVSQCHSLNFLFLKVALFRVFKSSQYGI